MGTPSPARFSPAWEAADVLPSGGNPGDGPVPPTGRQVIEEQRRRLAELKQKAAAEAQCQWDALHGSGPFPPLMHRSILHHLPMGRERGDEAEHAYDTLSLESSDSVDTSVSAGAASACSPDNMSRCWSTVPAHSRTPVHCDPPISLARPTVSMCHTHSHYTMSTVPNWHTHQGHQSIVTCLLSLCYAHHAPPVHCDSTTPTVPCPPPYCAMPTTAHLSTYPLPLPGPQVHGDLPTPTCHDHHGPPVHCGLPTPTVPCPPPHCHAHCLTVPCPLLPTRRPTHSHCQAHQSMVTCPLPLVMPTTAHLSVVTFPLVTPTAMLCHTHTMAH